MGLAGEVRTIPWEQSHYDAALGGYKTEVTGDQLRNAPEFSRRDDALVSGHECGNLIAYYGAMLEHVRRTALPQRQDLP